MQPGRTVPRRTRQSIYVVRDELDCNGCEFGRLNRERISRVYETVDKVDRKVNYVLAAVGLQLFTFLLTVVSVLVYRVGT